MTNDSPSPTRLTGQTIKGYELQTLIGQGGFGAVYRAYQPAIKREVAVKVILPEFVNEPEFIRRFESEAQIIARLEHIHIVPLYDYWRDAEGAFLVMRWLKGGSLRSALEKGHWPLDDVSRLVDQIASGLAVAHRQSVIHRDLKPDNILLDEENNVYLADFGIAKDLQDKAQLAALYAAEEAAGRLMGSPYYLSPEQIRNDPVSPQSDIYSLGIMLYEILTGLTPFQNLPISTVISMHLQDPMPSLSRVRPDLPDVLNEVIAKATEKDPADRYGSVIELATDFRRALSESGLLQTPVPTAPNLASLGITEDITPYMELEVFNPFKGLRAFQEADAEDFFGREALVADLLERFQGDGLTGRFLSVVGPSGSGKSSLVRAGLIPKLRDGAVANSDGWFMVEMTPGARPLEELEAALLRVAVNPPPTLLPQLREDERGLVRAVKRALPPAGAASGQEMLLLIDQFEEVFTQSEDEAERARFLNLLGAAARDPESRLRVITTLRADFYDRPLLYPDFGELVRECTEVVLPLSRTELERAIAEPAERANLRLEAGLLQEIVNDVGEQPGALPLLQYALTELYERRDGVWLTVEAYRQIGGVSGALARRADELYAGLDEAGQRAARQMFLRLVTLNEGAEDTRRRVGQEELLSLGEADMERVIDLFGKYRLLTFDRDPASRVPTVEIAHEALIRQWLRLREWLRTGREDMRMQRRLAAAAEEWLNAKQDASFLVSGSRLDQFEAWAAETSLMLNQRESDFLRASLAERDRLRALEAERQAKEAALERRSRNFLRALAVVMAVAAIGALGLSGVALSQRQLAEQNAVTATYAQGDALLQANAAATAASAAERNAAEAQSLVFTSGSQLALNNQDTDLALLLALQANQNGQSTVQTQRILAEAAYAPGTRRVFTGHDDRVLSAAYSPDGKMAVSASTDKTLIIWDVATGKALQRLQGHKDWVWHAVFSADGKYVLSASQDKTLMIWDAATGQALHTLEGHTDAVRAAAFSPDGKMALSGGQDGALILWDVATGQEIRRMQGNTTPVFSVAVSRSGFTALSGGKDGTITLWNLDTGEAITRYGAEGEGHTSEVWSVVYTPDEQGMLSGSDDSTLILWSFESGQPVRRFKGHSTRVTSVDISPDGRLAVSGSEDNSIVVWDLATAAIVRRFIGHTYLVYGVAFSPDGEQVLSASWDKTLRLWDLENGAQIRRFNGHTADVLGVAFSPDGKTALSASKDATLILWDVESGKQLRTLIGHAGAVNAVVFSADGKMALSGADDTSMILWDVNTGERIRQFGGPDSADGHSDAVWAVAFSPDGRLAASGSRDNTIILWDVATGQALQRLFGHTFRVAGVAFSPDGTQLLSGSFDNLLILWDVKTGKEVRRFQGHNDWVRSVAFSPDGTNILSASADNSLILWDTRTGQRIRRYEGHTAQVYSAAFSPDGRYAVSGAADTAIILWDVATGQELRRYSGHTDDVRGVAFSPDGRSILAGSGDSSVSLWQVSLSLDDLISWIKANRYLRDFTCAERDLYRIQPLCAGPTPVLGPRSV
jgi:WD40 repeat protein/serine/threonine protein kinase